jgi:hypothetical protein
MKKHLWVSPPMALALVIGAGLYTMQDATAFAASNPANLVGTGTVGDPYEISSAADLRAFDQNWKLYDGSYIQLQNGISLPSPTAGTSGNWQPVGTQAAPFSGTFDGAGHTITGLSIDNPAPTSLLAANLNATPVGLFGFVDGTVENLRLASVDITNNDPLQATGALAGVLASPLNDATAAPALLNDAVLSGTVTSDGGLSGQTLTAAGLGGLLGNNGFNFLGNSFTGGLVSSDWATADVQDNAAVFIDGQFGGKGLATGGLVGNNMSGVVQDSYAGGSVYGATAGGLIGQNYSTVDNAYASANVEGSVLKDGQASSPRGLAVGGLIGTWAGGGQADSITDTYAIGPVNGTGVQQGSTGGLIGYRTTGPNAAVTSSYYDTGTTGQTGSSGGTPESDAAMRSKSTFLSTATGNPFNFSTTWGDDGSLAPYPFLQTLPPFSSPFAGGSGSVSDPYMIDTVEQLQDVSAFLGRSFILGSNLSLGGRNWQPVGTQAAPFSGTFDGAGHTITGLSIDNPAPTSLLAANLNATPVGLFGFVDGTVENLRLASVDITNNDPLQATGALAGVLASPLNDATAAPALLNDAVLSGTVTSDGGLSGQTLTAAGLGGLLGNNGFNFLGNSFTGGLVSSDWATADVQDNAAVFIDGQFGGKGLATGGLVGNNMSGVVQDSYAGGSVYGATAGGLIGQNYSTVDNAYASANVEGSVLKDGQASSPRGLAVGGLIGTWAGGGQADSITDTYAIGPVNSTGVQQGSTGGLIGYRTTGPNAAVTSSYYDTGTTGQTGSSGGTPESDAAMKRQNTFANWNFVNTWSIASGAYPTLLALSGIPGTGQIPETPIAGLLPVVGVGVTLWLRRRWKSKTSALGH